MEFVKTQTVSPNEKQLTKWQKGQWYASQFSVGFGMAYMAFDLASLVPYYAGIGVYSGLISALVAGFGGAVVAKRAGASWSAAKKKVGFAYAVLSGLSIVGSLVQIGLASYLISANVPALNQLFSNGVVFLPARTAFTLAVVISLCCMILSGVANSIFDGLCMMHALRMVKELQ